MMQHKFLLFSAVCCCLLQAMLCDLPPTTAMFRSRSSRNSSLPSKTTSSPISSSGTADQLSTNQNNVIDSNTSSSPENLSKAVSRKNSNSKDPLDIKDLDELKERSKELLLDLLRDEDANKAITFMATNVKDLLENEVASNIITTHTNLVKGTLTNEEAKGIIRNILLDIFNTFKNPETPEKVQVVLENTKQFLSRRDLPGLLKKRFKILKKIINCKKSYSAVETLKKALVKSLSSSDIKMKIAKGFKLLDFGIHFDPNNVLKSLTGYSFFK